MEGRRQEDEEDKGKNLCEHCGGTLDKNPLKPVWKTPESVVRHEVITGVLRGYSEEDLKEMILLENEDIDIAFGHNFRENVKEVGKRRKCRNDSKENITFKVSIEIFKYLIRKVKIFLDMGVVIFEETLNVSQCFNYNKFGQVARFFQTAMT